MSEGERTVVRVITWLPVGGIERRLVAVLPRLAEKGWGVRVACIREEGPLAAELRDGGIPVDVVPVHGRLSPGGIARLAGAFRRWGADVVHTHMYRANIPGTLGGWWAGTAVRLAQVHNVDSWDSPRQALVDRHVARFRTGTIAVSAAVQADVCRRLGLRREHVPILYNGIDMDRFVFDEEAGERLRREWGATAEEVVFVVPARLHPQKNPLGVLEAFAAGPAAKGARLVFAGDGKMRDELSQRAEAVGLAERVVLAGRRDDMAAVYSAADVVVLSSLKEGFSNALVEGLACGRPAIASRVGGNPEAIDRPEVGWIHKSGDGGALRAQMEAAMGLGRAGLRAMAEDCRGHAQRFSLERLVDETDALYRRALDGRMLVDVPA